MHENLHVPCQPCLLFSLPSECSSSSEGDISGQRIDESYEDIHLRETKVSPEGPEGEGVSRKNLLERRNSVPLKLSSESPQGTSEGKGGKISLVELDLETLEGMPTTPAPRHSEQFVSPKSLSMSPNIKVLGRLFFSELGRRLSITRCFSDGNFFFR